MIVCGIRAHVTRGGHITGERDWNVNRRRRFTLRAAVSFDANQKLSGFNHITRARVRPRRNFSLRFFFFF